MYQKILLASDGSDHAMRATEHAIKFVKASANSMLELVYVLDDDKKRGKKRFKGIVEDKAKEKIKLTEQKLKHSGVSYKLTILKGDPKHEIVEYANSHHIDMCIVGSRGLNKLQEMVLGSVSHKVAKHIHCPLIIVK
ncbi:universal stress protein [Gracilibacillus sp. YIM 98692]|uniref:universal stress protein n=1 Tax=Gracilibacillus sp. YIM 98692 TaxID=2663532 RepID=UPI0013D6DBB3|nr:universal stress protein [Gracilibacillus sp. YIM 98692]